MVALSVAKSDLVPTNMMGVSGAWCLNSGAHLLTAFSNDVGLRG